MIKTKLSVVVGVNEALKKIVEDKDINPSFKFKVLGVTKALESDVANFELIKNEKIKEYGEKNEDGSVFISGDNKDAVEKFSNDMNELLNTDVELNVTKLKASDVFANVTDLNVLNALYYIIDNDMEGENAD